MPCVHGLINWWNCPACKSDEAIREHNAVLAVENHMKDVAEAQLRELEKIRKLLDKQATVKSY